MSNKFEIVTSFSSIISFTFSFFFFLTKMEEESRRTVKDLHKEADKVADEVELPGVY